MTGPRGRTGRRRTGTEPAASGNRSDRPLGETTGLLSLMRPGRLTELLVLLELSTRPTGRLRPIADRLGVSVQTISLLQRRFRREGKVAVIGGRYHTTPAGVAELHAQIASMRSDLDTRMGDLQLVRECRAIAARSIRAGTPVVLFMKDGDLYARAGTRGPSRGIVQGSARTGELVEVRQLEGVLPLPPAKILCLVVPTRTLADPMRLVPHLRRALTRTDAHLLGAEGLEAVHAMRRATARPFVRFGVAAAAREASLLGVPAAVAVSDTYLTSFLQRLAEPGPALPIEVRTVGPS